MNDLARKLAIWHHEFGRHDLPWQGQGPYATWISEIMLQQTQVRVVIPYFERFMAAFPDPVTLANASLDAVLAHWAGLGYYARARNLHAAAQQIRDDFDGVIPDTLADLMTLRGIGRSTAGAILSLGFEKFGVIQDGNVRRVLARLFLMTDDLSRADAQKRLWDLATELTPTDGAASAIHTQAMMDLGAIVCTRSQPNCQHCPLAADCRAHLSGCTSEIPRPKKVKQRPTEQWVVLHVLDKNGRSLLYRRPNEGIWGGLYAPPIADNLLQLGEALGLTNVLDAEEESQLEHAFSHFKVQLTLYRLQASVSHPPDSATWEVLEDFQGGLPAPIEKLLLKRQRNEQSRIL